MSLRDFEKNFYSQNGEDGIIEELLRRLRSANPSSPWCVEFGAWDGKHLSNTFHLVESANWNAIYIEGDRQKYQELESTARDFPAVVPVPGMVGRKGRALDEILSATQCPQNYGVLSIDIDSYDLEVWADHNDYRPDIVIIEINSSLPPGILQWHSDNTQGNSFSSTLQVAASKRYTLVCHTGNMIFVADERIDHVGLDAMDREFPERLFSSKWIQSAEPWVRSILKRAGARLPNRIKETRTRA